jgi:integrase/recombinase XerD
MPSNLYRRGRTWWGRVQVAGRDVRRSLRTRDRAEAARRLKAWLEEVSRRRWGEERHSWKEAVVKWAAEVKPGLKESTGKRYQVSLRQVSPILEPLHLDEIDLKTIGRIAGRSGPSNATRRRDLTAVSSVLRSCVGWGWLERNPALEYDRSLIRERRDPIALPDVDEVEQLIKRAHTVAKLDGGTLGYLVAFLRQSGMRLEEAAQLTRPRIDFTRSAATVARSKRDRAREVPLSEAAVETLRAVPAHMSAQTIFWHGAEGEPYRNLSSRLAALRRKIGIAWTTHDLRHLYAVEYLRAGGSIYDLQQILGHSSIKTTEIYLAFLTPEEQRIAKRVVARA